MLYFIAMCTEKPLNVCTAYYIKTSEILKYISYQNVKKEKIETLFGKMESIVFRTLPFSVFLSKKLAFLADQVFR